MSNETMTDAPQNDYQRGYRDGRKDEAARLRGEAAQGEQRAVAFGHVYRVVVDANHASARAPWDKQRGVVFEVGPGPRDGVDGHIQYLNLYTRPQPAAVAGDAVRSLITDWKSRSVHPKASAKGTLVACAMELDAALSAAPAAPAHRIEKIAHSDCEVILTFADWRKAHAYYLENGRTADPITVSPTMVAVQTAWEWAGGDTGITATIGELEDMLRMFGHAAPAPVAGDAVCVDDAMVQRACESLFPRMTMDADHAGLTPQQRKAMFYVCVRDALHAALAQYRAPQSPPTDEAAAFEAWFRGEQGTAYDGAWSFARAAWMHRASQGAAAGVPAQGWQHDWAKHACYRAEALASKLAGTKGAALFVAHAEGIADLIRQNAWVDGRPHSAPTQGAEREVG